MHPAPKHHPSIIPSVAAALVGAALVLALHAGGKWIRLDLFWPIAAALCLGGAIAFAVNRRRRSEAAESDRPPTSLLILVGSMVALFGTSAATYKWFYGVDWAASTSTPSAPIVLALLILLAVPLACSRWSRRAWVYAAAFVVFAAWSAYTFQVSSRGLPLYNDDHPSFMFRLWVLAKSLPRLVVYNPWWNAGNLEHAAIETGAVAPGLLLRPLWTAFPIHEVYNLGVLILFLVILPLLAVGSMRVMGFGWVAGWIAAILTLGVSRFFFLWLFNYGTLGANCVAFFVIPIAACLYRAIVLEKRKPWLLLALSASAFFLLLWPIGAFAAVPLALPVIFHMRRLRPPTLLWLAGAAALGIVLYAYPMASILNFTDVGHRDWVVESHAPVSAWTSLLREDITYLFDHLGQAHPVLLFLGIAGSLVFVDRSLGCWFAPILVGFALMVGWGQHLVPDLPLFRLAIPMMFAAVPPAAALSERLLVASSRRGILARAALIAVLWFGGWNVTRLYANCGPGPYDVMPDDIRTLAEWGRKETPANGRICIAGATGHTFGGGHVPYLPVLLQREMLCVDFRHDVMPGLDRGTPPRYPINDVAPMEDYVRLFGAQDLITLDPYWLMYFDLKKDLFEDKGTVSGTGFRHFRVREPTGRFAMGSGLVSADLNRLAVKLDDPDAPVVIRYLWTSGLEADGVATLFPHDMGSGVNFIGIKPNGQRDVIIRFTRWL